MLVLLLLLFIGLRGDYRAAKLMLEQLGNILGLACMLDWPLRHSTQYAV